MLYSLRHKDNKQKTASARTGVCQNRDKAWLLVSREEDKKNFEICLVDAVWEDCAETMISKYSGVRYLNKESKVYEDDFHIRLVINGTYKGHVVCFNPSIDEYALCEFPYGSNIPDKYINKNDLGEWKEEKDEAQEMIA